MLFTDYKIIYQRLNLKTYATALLVLCMFLYFTFFLFQFEMRKNKQIFQKKKLNVKQWYFLKPNILGQFELQVIIQNKKKVMYRCLSTSIIDLLKVCWMYKYADTSCRNRDVRFDAGRDDADNLYKNNEMRYNCQSWDNYLLELKWSENMVRSYIFVRHKNSYYPWLFQWNLWRHNTFLIEGKPMRQG